MKYGGGEIACEMLEVERRSLRPSVLLISSHSNGLFIFSAFAAKVKACWNLCSGLLNGTGLGCPERLSALPDLFGVVTP